MAKSLKKSNYKIPKSLLVFCLISFLFWMLIKLSKTYESEQVVTLKYINLPSNKLLQNEPLQETRFTLKSSGFRLLASKFTNNDIKIDVKPVRQKNNALSYIYIPAQQKRIESQLKYGVKITDFENDTLYFDFGYLATKKIPIVPNYKINYKSGFSITDSIYFKPDSITLSGPEKTIDTITKINLDFFELNDIEKNINHKIEIKPFDLKNVRIKEKTITATATIEKFTEGEIEIPFTILNLPEDIKVNTFPKNVKLVYKVSLSNFNEVNANSFSVVCDFKYSQENNLSYLIPKLIRTSDFSSNEKIVPNKIDFLIQK